MTWHWFPFLVGAPVWASVGIVLFASLMRDGAHVERRSEDLGARIARHRRDAEDPSITSLSAYRLVRARGAHSAEVGGTR